MATSDDWAKLATSFQSVPAIHEFAAHRYSFLNSRAEPQWETLAEQTALREFDPLARRAASMLPTPPTGDLLIAWLEALWKDATTGTIRLPSEILDGVRAEDIQSRKVKVGTVRVLGKIEHVFQSSYALCRQFESTALQAEFEKKQRENPQNLTAFGRRVEAFQSIKEIRNEPAFRIPEAVVRNIIAEMDGIKPEDVTWQRIAFEVASFLSSTRRHIEVTPSTPSSEPQPIPDAEPDEQAKEESEVQREPITPTDPQPFVEELVDEKNIEPKVLRDRYLANFPDEKIKIRDICWAAGQHYREWKRWLAGVFKRGSTPDLAFRRVLTSGKRPTELQKKPRPPKWE